MRTFNTLMLIKLLSRSSDFPTNIQDEKGNQKEPKTRPRGAKTSNGSSGNLDNQGSIINSQQT